MSNIKSNKKKITQILTGTLTIAAALSSINVQAAAKYDSTFGGYQDTLTKIGDEIIFGDKYENVAETHGPVYYQISLKNPSSTGISPSDFLEVKSIYDVYGGKANLYSPEELKRAVYTDNDGSLSVRISPASPCNTLNEDGKGCANNPKLYGGSKGKIFISYQIKANAKTEAGIAVGQGLVNFPDGLPEGGVVTNKLKITYTPPGQAVDPKIAEAARKIDTAPRPGAFANANQENLNSLTPEQKAMISKAQNDAANGTSGINTTSADSKAQQGAKISPSPNTTDSKSPDPKSGANPIPVGANEPNRVEAKPVSADTTQAKVPTSDKNTDTLTLPAVIAGITSVAVVAGLGIYFMLGRKKKDEK